MNQLESLQQLEEKAHKEKNRVIKFVLLQQLGDKLVAEKDLGYALHIYEQALKVAQKMLNDELEYNTFVDLGLTAEALGEIESAEDFYQEALKIAQKMRNFIAQSDIYDRLGTLSMEAGNIDIANQYFEQAADEADIAELTPIEAEEKQTATTSSPKIGTNDSEPSPTIQKTIAISNEIAEFKNLHKAQQAIVIIVIFVLIITLYFVVNIFYREELNTTPLFVFGLFIFISVIALITLAFVQTSKIAEFWRELIGRLTKR